MNGSTTQQSLGEQPANNDQVIDAGAQPQTGNITERFESLSAEQQAAILFADEAGENDNSSPAPQAPPKESKEEEIDTDQNPDDGIKNADENSNAQGQEGSKSAPKRVSVRALADDQQVLVARAVEMVRNGSAPNLFAATAILAKEAGVEVTPAAIDPETGKQADGTDQPPQNNQPPETPTAKIVAIQDEISQLRQQRKEAKENFDIELESSLTDQIEDKLAELSEVKATAKVSEMKQQEQVSAYQQKYEATVEQIEARYPELLEADSNFSRVFDGMVAAARERGDAMLQDPTHLAAIADEVAGILKVQPATKEPQTRTNLPAPPPRVMPNGSAVAPGHTQARRMGSDDVMRFIQTATPEQLRELVDA